MFALRLFLLASILSIIFALISSNRLLHFSIDATHESSKFVYDTDTRSTRILLMSYVFSKVAADKKYLRMFIESSYSSGVDILIVGDHKLSYILPSNVKHKLISFGDLASLVFEKVFDGVEVGDLRSAPGYKVNDLKPLFAYLFPKEVKGYGWWGWVDNDVVLGHVRTYITNEVLDRYDIVSAYPGEKSYGAFTLFRNDEKVNKLFLSAGKDVLSVAVGSRKNQCFDEWGQCADGGFNSSIAGLVHHKANVSGIKWYGLPGFPVGNDIQCSKRNPNWCNVCFKHPDGKVTRVENPIENQHVEQLMCHYYAGKKNLEVSLTNSSKLNLLLEQNMYKVSFRDGFDFFESS